MTLQLPVLETICYPCHMSAGSSQTETLTQVTLIRKDFQGSFSPEEQLREPAGDRSGEGSSTATNLANWDSHNYLLTFLL